MNTQPLHSHDRFLCCPITGSNLTRSGQFFLPAKGNNRYRINLDGIPLFADEFISDDAKIQQTHYEKIAKVYAENQTYPHTREYCTYFDQALFDEISDYSIGMMLELCCGKGEAIKLLEGQYSSAIGVDVSESMLTAGLSEIKGSDISLIQGDATRLPLQSEVFDTVVMLGGVHHVNNQQLLFSEICRVLKPGGMFIWREPVDDFLLWKIIRKVIYRISSHLDQETEQPLRRNPVEMELLNQGLKPKNWKTLGFMGYCLFMNSDVLVFNRLFRFIPGIRGITRLFINIDRITLRLPGMGNNGLAVIGSATKPT